VPEEQQAKKRKKLVTVYFSLLLILPFAFVIVYWIILYVGVYAAMIFSWEFERGAIMTRGSDSCMLVNKGMLMTTELGYRRVSASYLETISIYHAVIVSPTTGFSSSSYNSEGPKSTEVIEWSVESNDANEGHKVERKKLAIELHTLDSTVQVGNNKFNLREGNFFLIDIDSSWTISASQLPLFNYGDSGCVPIVEQFNSVLKGKIADYPLVINPRELK
jgi:hypothetical protein